MRIARFQYLIPILLLMAVQQTPAQLQNPKGLAYDWNTDTTQHVVPLSEIQMVVPRGTFPAIDYPGFLGRREGLQRFFEHEPVIALAIEGQAKAYPLNMLTMHEISNDELAGVPILPTYCPLCNASVVYDRRLRHDGKDYLLTFEVSGMLRSSDMVMADKQTETWWQQLTGQGLVGELAGAQLKVIPSLVLSVRAFFERYPDGRILSPDTDTPAAERYGTNPYVGYDHAKNQPYSRYFDAEKLDERLPPMERVVDIRGREGYKIYPFSAIQNAGVINDSYDGRPVVLFYQPGAVSVLDKPSIEDSRAIGTVAVFTAEMEGKRLTFHQKGEHFLDEQTESRWDVTGRCVAGPYEGEQLPIEPHSHHFAFAWLSFYPDSEIYRPQ